MKSWHINILTLFPEMFPGPLEYSLSGKALLEKKWSYETYDIRAFGQGVHKSVDDTPYGGGAGMVMRADIIEKAFLSIKKPGRKVFLSPRGRVFNQALAEEFIKEESLTLLCGRYEGIDQRVIDTYGFEEVSVGDYVLSGGEPAALILMDACIRLLPGVMGNEATISEESFSNGLLEYPHYTRPNKWEDVDGNIHKVPDILKSGNHKKIMEWRYEQSLKLTALRRPDLLSKKED
jgi:tRNA (guanine37-N1)-methyltransferase